MLYLPFNQLKSYPCPSQMLKFRSSDVYNNIYKPNEMFV